MFRVGILLSIFIYGSFSYTVDFDFDGMDREWSRGLEPVVEKIDGGSTSECKKDIWILWDNSKSVGYASFEDKVKPFLKAFFKSPRLNVSPQGTHIGILTFSTEAKTRVLLKMGEIQEESKLMDFLDNLNYNKDLMGDGTRTGMALRKANKELFPKTNPDNHRPDVSDVILLFSDGQPIRRNYEHKFGDRYKGNSGETLLATDMADEIKSRDIQIVALAIGLQSTLKKFRHDMINWASPKKYFETDADSLKQITNDLISASCIDPGQCTCLPVNAEAYTVPGNRVSLSWIVPKMQCESGRKASIFSTEIVPPLTPPSSFGVGQHTVMYTYGYRRGTKIVKQQCPVNIDVKSCECPSLEPVTVEMPPRRSKAFVEWSAPEPNCPKSLRSVAPAGAKSGHGHFGIGSYDFTYNYDIHTGSGRVSLSCPIKINVRGKLCGGLGYGGNQVCCCGSIYDSKYNHNCCGPKYYDRSMQKCVDFYTLVPI